MIACMFSTCLWTDWSLIYVIIIIFGNDTCETRLCETKRRSQNIVMTVFCAMTAFYFCGQINGEIPKVSLNLIDDGEMWCLFTDQRTIIASRKCWHSTTATTCSLSLTDISDLQYNRPTTHMWYRRPSQQTTRLTSHATLMVSGRSTTWWSPCITFAWTSFGWRHWAVMPVCGKCCIIWSMITCSCKSNSCTSPCELVGVSAVAVPVFPSPSQGQRKTPKIVKCTNRKLNKSITGTGFIAL